MDKYWNFQDFELDFGDFVEWEKYWVKISGEIRILEISRRVNIRDFEEPELCFGDEALDTITNWKCSQIVFERASPLNTNLDSRNFGDSIFTRCYPTLENDSPVVDSTKKRPEFQNFEESRYMERMCKNFSKNSPLHVSPLRFSRVQRSVSMLSILSSGKSRPVLIVSRISILFLLLLLLSPSPPPRQLGSKQTLR